MSYITKACQICACILLFCGYSYAQDKVVNFLNWAQYIAPDVVPDFTAKTGININQNYFDSEDTLIAELMAGSVGYDVAMMDVVDIPQESQAGVIQPIDKSKLSNYQYRNQDLYDVAAETDPGNKYGIIYSYGTTGIAYNAKLVAKVLGPDVKIDSWKFLYDPKYLSKLQSCGVAFLDDAHQIFGLTRFYLGLDPNSTKAEDYQKATDYMMSIRPYITYFDNDRYISDLASGNICIAMGYSGDVLRAKQQAQQANADVDIHYILPKEGSAIWFDMIVLVKSAPHPDDSLKFINYILNPKVMADISNYLFQPNAVVPSTPMLDPILQDPAFTPTHEMMTKLFNVRNQPPQLNNLVNQLWFQIKYGVNMD